MHRATERFWESDSNLPRDIQELADKSFRLLRDNPRHPSQHFKKVGGFWSARVGFTHRPLAVEDGNDFIWVGIGTHDEYGRLILRSRS